MTRNVEQRRTLDPVGTRTAILEAAVEVFCAKGFTAASMGEIADKAKVTKSLVQYHFRNKRSLWETALRSQMEPFLEAVDEAIRDIPTHGLSSLVQARFRLLQERPHIVRLMAWISLQPELIPNIARERSRALMTTLSDHYGVVPGAGVPKTLDLLLGFAASDGWFQFRGLYSTLIGAGLTQEQLDEKVLQGLLGALFGNEGANA